MKIQQLLTLVHTSDDDEVTKDVKVTILRCILDNFLTDTSDVSELISGHESMVQNVADTLVIHASDVHKELMEIYQYKEVFEEYEHDIVELLRKHEEDDESSEHDEVQDPEDDECNDCDIVQYSQYYNIIDRLCKIDNVVNLSMLVSTVTLVMSGLTMLVVMSDKF